MKHSNDYISNGQYKKFNDIIKNVDKYLLAERIAIEVKTQNEVFHNIPSNFNMCIDFAQDALYYTTKEEHEILNTAEKILKEKYNIIITSRNPLKLKYHKP